MIAKPMKVAMAHTTSVSPRTSRFFATIAAPAMNAGIVIGAYRKPKSAMTRRSNSRNSRLAIDIVVTAYFGAKTKSVYKKMSSAPLISKYSRKKPTNDKNDAVTIANRRTRGRQS